MGDSMDGVFNTGPKKDLNDQQFEKWIEYKQRAGNSIRGVIVILGLVGLVCGTIILVNWSPWS